MQALVRPGARSLKKHPHKKSESAANAASAAPRAATDPHRIVDAAFLAGAGPGSSLPAPAMVEIAFAGRSNVGKSSLVNSLVERKSLVRTSSSPGSTRQINLYEARAADGAVFHLVDLPGYGFSRRSKEEKASWATLIEGYLRTRATLGALVLLVDARRGLEDDDRELIEFVDTIDMGTRVSRRPVEVLLVATKLDKLPRAQRKVALDRVRASANRRVYGYSSETAEGRPELWAALRRAALGAPPTSPTSEVPAAPREGPEPA